MDAASVNFVSVLESMLGDAELVDGIAMKFDAFDGFKPTMLLLLFVGVEPFDDLSFLLMVALPGVLAFELDAFKWSDPFLFSLDFLLFLIDKKWN